MNLSEDARIIYQGRRRTVHDASIWWSRLQSKLQRLSAFWMARRRRARGLRELYEFSDRELWDMGLGRSDLPAIINGTYRRD
jgi:uncharacterized protein YjiS (DUF1127 family)